MKKEKTVAFPNSIFPLLPTKSVSVTKLMPKLHLGLLGFSLQNLEIDVYEVYLDDLFAFLNIKKTTRSLQQVKEALDGLRAYSINVIEFSGPDNKFKREVYIDQETNVTTIGGPKQIMSDYDQVTVGLIDRPGFRVRSGVSSKIIWRLDPAIKSILANLNDGNFTPLVLLALGELSLAATILACECFKFRWHFKGRSYGSTKEMPIEYWYMALLGRWDVTNVKFGIFNQRTLKPAIEEIKNHCPFSVEFEPTFRGNAVVGGYFKIYNKAGEGVPTHKKEGDACLPAFTDSQTEGLLTQLSSLNIPKERALKIIKKFPDFDYLSIHIQEHLKQKNKGGKPILNHEAMLRTRLEEDWGDLKYKIKLSALQKEAEKAKAEKEAFIFKLFAESKESTRDMHFNEFLGQASELAKETYLRSGRDSGLVQSEFRQFILKKLA